MPDIRHDDHNCHDREQRPHRRKVLQLAALVALSFSRTRQVLHGASLHCADVRVIAGLVIMATASDCPSGAPEQLKDESDDQQNDTEGPQDRYSGNETNNQKDDAQDDHCGSQLAPEVAYQGHSPHKRKVCANGRDRLSILSVTRGRVNESQG
jgi:hypothetical protein